MRPVELVRIMWVAIWLMDTCSAVTFIVSGILLLGGKIDITSLSIPLVISGSFSLLGRMISVIGRCYLDKTRYSSEDSVWGDDYNYVAGFLLPA